MADQLLGEYLTTKRVNKGLVLELTRLGKDWLIKQTERAHAEIWRTLLFDLEARHDLHMLGDDEYELVGALTSSPVIVTKPSFDEDTHELIGFDAVFWFPNYQI